MALFQSSVALFVCIRKFGQAVIRIINCLSNNELEITLLFIRFQVISTWIGQVKNILKVLLPWWTQASMSVICR